MKAAPSPIPFFAPRDTCNGSCMAEGVCQCYVPSLGREAAEPVPDSVYADAEADSVLEQCQASRDERADGALDLASMLMLFASGGACGVLSALLYHFFVGLPA